MKLNPWDGVEIKHICGHTQIHRKFGRVSRDEMIKAWAPLLCKECNQKRPRPQDLNTQSPQ